MTYDDWKTRTPDDEQHSAGCDGVHDDDAGDYRCTVCYWEPEEDVADEAEGPNGCTCGHNGDCNCPFKESK